MDIGEKLRQIRLLQGKTQKEMNGNYFDRSFYSRIENGENNIAAKDLIKILQKNNISVVDFKSAIDVKICCTTAINTPVKNRLCFACLPSAFNGC